MFLCNYSNSRKKINEIQLVHCFDNKTHCKLNSTKIITSENTKANCSAATNKPMLRTYTLKKTFVLSNII